jgi:hypothetical protein
MPLDLMIFLLDEDRIGREFRVVVGNDHPRFAAALSLM